MISMAPVKYFTIRMDESELVSREAVKKWLNDEWPNAFVVREVSDKTGKPHYQGYIGDDCSNTQVLRRSLRKQFPSVFEDGKRGNRGKYSIAEVRDFELYRSYLCKGTVDMSPDVVYHGRTLDVSSDFDPVEMWRLGRDPGRNRVASRVKSARKSFSTQLVDTIVRDYKCAIMDCSDDYEKRKYVCSRILEYYRDEKKPVNVHYVRQLINAVMLQVVYGYIDRLSEEIVRFV